VNANRLAARSFETDQLQKQVLFQAVFWVARVVIIRYLEMAQHPCCAGVVVIVGMGHDQSEAIRLVDTALDTSRARVSNIMKAPARQVRD